MALPSASTENGASLRKISDEANEIIRGLDAIGKIERDCWPRLTLNQKADGFMIVVTIQALRLQIFLISWTVVAKS